MPATFRSKPSPFKFGGRKRFSKRRGSGRPPKEDDGSASSPFPSAPPSPSALESPIASLPPAERHPGPSASASSWPVTEISSEDDLTAIERKIAMMQRKAPAKCSERSEHDDPEKQLGLTEGEELDGYRLLGVSCIEALFASLKTVECAVALAVLEFNPGPRGIEQALLEMGIQPGSYQASYGERATMMKFAKAQVKALESSKMSHKKRKMEAVAKAQRDRAEEGVTYAPGAF
ncbi:hypothetical protein HPB47_001598 [Ixodes persulcatus]|uniref:Uncharacterized protein n=1 Tax=Ixodes persulcatus TaxID=34615 RepID=A0AC60PNR6_IXOPE|nr:hypothetical protein HPB47_001598 [Ixodes persulcatus]